MDGFRAARLNDAVQCTCCCDDCCPCPNGQIVSASTDTFVNNKGAARLGDTATNCCGCCCACPNRIVGGSASTFINNKPAARKSDPVTCGFIVQASTDTFIG